MRVNDNFVLRKIYGEFLLFPVRENEAGDELVSLNEVGADVWELAQTGLAEAEIIASIVKTYGLEARSVEEESVRIFISALCEKKLLYREEHDI